MWQVKWISVYRKHYSLIIVISYSFSRGIILTCVSVQMYYAKELITRNGNGNIFRIIFSLDFINTFSNYQKGKYKCAKFVFQTECQFYFNFHFILNDLFFLSCYFLYCYSETLFLFVFSHFALSSNTSRKHIALRGLETSSIRPAYSKLF